MPEPRPGFRIEADGLALDAVELLEEPEGLGGDRALVLDMEFVELAAGVGQAAGLGDAQVEERLVARVVVADQDAAPVAEEVPGVLPGAGLGEVVEDGPEGREGRGGVGS